MTQCEQILDFMERNGSITQMDALACFGCARLASRICDLKKAGYNIEKETVKVRCRNGSFAYVAAYSFYKTKEELNAAYRNLIVNEIMPNIPKGLSATVYTQLSDVEDEVNGFITYDRKVIKIDNNMVKSLNSLIQFLD